MPLVDTWASVKSAWGDGVPHKLEELEFALPEGLVTVELRYSKVEHTDQRVEVQLSDSGNYATIMGRSSADVWFTAEDPWFLVSDRYERIYFSRDRETMRTYLSAKQAYQIAEKNLKKKFDKDQADARDDLKRAEAERKKLMDVLDRFEASWTTGGYMDDRKAGLQWEKIWAQDDKIKAARATLSKGLPLVDTSYVLAIRTAGLASLSLDKILGVVASTRAELVRTLGVLPKKLTVIPVEPTLNLVVEWRD